MKTFFYFIVTIFISTGAMFAALNLKNPWPAFAIAFGMWALFVWHLRDREKKARIKRERERLFEEYMRMQLRKDQERR
jgi:hypothetical protein